MTLKGTGTSGLGESVFTTGDAAKYCRLSQQTIIRCFDNGLLKGFRVPGSRFRRIPRDNLLTFMRDNGIPTDALGVKSDGEENGRATIAQGTSEANGSNDTHRIDQLEARVQNVEAQQRRFQGMLGAMLQQEAGADGAQAS